MLVAENRAKLEAVVCCSMCCRVCCFSCIQVSEDRAKSQAGVAYVNEACRVVMSHVTYE